MKTLKKAYREAPKIASPTALDARILHASRTAARARVPSESRPSRRWVAGYAVAYLCMAGVGLGILLESGMMPFAEDTRLGDEMSVPRVNDTAQSDDNLRKSVTRRQTVAETTATSSGEPPVDTSSDLFVESAPQSAVAMDSEAVEVVSVESADLTTEVLDSETGDADNRGIVSSAKRSSAGLLSAEDGQSRAADSLAMQTESAGLTAAPSSVYLAEEVTGSVVSTTNELASNDAPGRDSAGWLASQSPDHFTVLLASAPARSALLRLADSLPVAAHLVRIATDNPARDSVLVVNGSWRLLHGSFADVSDADRLLTELRDIAAVSMSEPQGVTVHMRSVSFSDLQK